jgi:hypothetical protein
MSAENRQVLNQLLDAAFQQQKLIFYGMGIVAALTGVGILIMSFVVPPAPGEERIVAVLQGVAVVFILFCGWCFWYVRRRLAQVLDLIYKRPGEIASVKTVTVTRRGISGHAIRLHTRDGQMVGFNVQGSQRQELLRRIVDEIPHLTLSKG